MLKLRSDLKSRSITIEQSEKKKGEREIRRKKKFERSKKISNERERKCGMAEMRPRASAVSALVWGSRIFPHDLLRSA